MIKRLLKLPLSLILFLGLISFTVPNAQANELDLGNSNSISTVENYIEYLRNSPDRAELLEQFLSLSKEDQELFVEALKPENFFDAFALAQENLNEDTVFELNNRKEIEVKMISENSDDNESIGDSSIMPLTTYRETTGKARCVFTILGLEVAEYRAGLVYQSDGTNALQVYDIEKSYNNNNPLVWTTENGYTNKYVSGGWAYGGYSWTLSSTGSLGALSASVDMYVKAKPGKRSFKVDSGRSDWAIPWTEY
ncbi:hypothetical protein [Lysinibacillus sp. JNUCC 51]|uniref:hypothetical protein n=1 Tax=Lysinibacillus sp. JNUCC-51 TaxID=2792479 RepID=UPI001934C0CB|nr:hypothetical protein JNUCC51_00180 [Lysinibacillus sp. JNUCC-51]